ncbi:MAG: class I SAM-dependent methyltransferase [Eubacteriales bacterium]|nr:class I SAM-dependent methyltransferase [Eubacteriales bacterium]
MDVSNMRAAMFNQKAEKDADKVIESLGISAGNVIADLGSGGGFFTFEFAKVTGAGGKIYAADTDDGLLAHIKNQQYKKQLANIETIKSADNNANLPQNSCDLVFLRNVFHHIADPVTYFRGLKKNLKKGGHIAVIEWKPGASHHGHGATEEEILGIMLSAGYQRTQSFDFLDKQSFNIFQAKE